MRQALLRPLLVVAVLALGCDRASLEFEVLEPPPMNLGLGRQLTVLHTEGRPAAREQLVAMMAEGCARTGLLQLVDRSYEGIQVRQEGEGVVIYGARPPGLRPEEIGLRLDVLDWVVQQDSSYQRRSGVYRAQVSFSLLAFDSGGRVLMRPTEYSARATDPHEGRALHYAAGAAVTQLLASLAPRRARHSVELDTQDPRQEYMLDMAQAGRVAEAIKRLERYVREHPESASAHYNLGALRDVQALYPEALEAYDRALALEPSPLYVQTREACAQRLEHARALGLQ
jgi:tetratricopeptide (TPR) repeat protein